MTLLGNDVDDVAYADGRVWVTQESPQALVDVDPHTGRVVSRIALGKREAFPFAVAVGGAGYWVANAYAGTLAHVDPLLRRVVATTPRLANAFDLTRPAVGREAAWLASTSGGTVYRVDGDTSRVVAVVALPPEVHPVDLAVGAGYVWAAVA